LRQYHERWRTLTPLSLCHVTSLESVGSWKLVDGIFARMNPPFPNRSSDPLSSTVTFYTLPTSRSRNAGSGIPEAILPKKTVSYHCYIVDFAIDPGQDLLVLLESEYVKYWAHCLGLHIQHFQ
jgi:hypothetical protein